MARSTPYLQRRGHIFFFRIDVPLLLRPVVGCREITKTLATERRSCAEPLALELGAVAKRLFSDLRLAMNDKNQMLRLLHEAAKKIQRVQMQEEHQEELDARDRDHAHDLRRVKLETENLSLKSSLAAISTMQVQESGLGAPKTTKTSPKSAVTLGTVVESFLASPGEQKKLSMFKKYQTVLPLLLESVGPEKPVADLLQNDLNEFFKLVARLPSRWSDQCRKRGISAAALAKEDHKDTLGPKTFEDTYLACIRSFLKVAKKDWQDQGFPVHISTDGIEYFGDRTPGESKQRAFKPVELERLFFGPELVQFKADPTQEHQFWLSAVGLLTGARVNEIAQLNPQVDILKEEETDIWFLNITELTEGDERVRKSTKTPGSRRKVPLHKWLIELGFLAYVERMQKAGSQLLFPAWKPSRGKASSAAEKWFGNFLIEIGLRDDTAGARLVGMHAFRHTLLARASNTHPPVDATSITGHANSKGVVVRGYEGEFSLVNKQRELHAIDFGIELTAARYSKVAV